MWITRISIRNPVFATMFMVGIAVLGLFAYNRLRTEQMPDVSLPFVFVRTFYPGASPEVVETDEDGLVIPLAKPKAAAGPVGGPDRERLERALQDLVACKQLLDAAVKDG